MTEVSIEEYERRSKVWADALYSPEYEQCTGGLHKEGDGYCCLGVAAEVSKLGFWRDSDDESDGDPLCGWTPLGYKEQVKKIAFEDGEDGEIPSTSDLMPPDVMEYYGVKTQSGSFDWFTLPADLRWKILQELMNPKIGLNEGEKESLLDQGAGNETHSLVFLNDKEVSFWLIAEVIKAKPRGLFAWIH